MKLRKIKSFSLALAACVLSLSAFAQTTMYVGDVIYVPLRSGPSVQNRIINKGLKSGTALELIEYNEDNSWAHVRVDDSEDGWLPSHYLDAEKPAAQRLEIAEKQLQDLRQKFGQTSSDKKTAESDLNSANEKVAALEDDKSKLSAELNRIRNISAGAIELDKKYRDLLQQYEVLRTENNALSTENENLKSDHSLTFMIYGAVLILVGMFAITLLPRLKPRKRNSDWIN